MQHDLGGGQHGLGAHDLICGGGNKAKPLCLQFLPPIFTCLQNESKMNLILDILNEQKATEPSNFDLELVPQDMG